MPRKRIHPIWSIPTDELTIVVSQSSTLAEVLRHYGFLAEGAHYGILKTRLQRDSIDFSHIQLGRGHSKGRPGKSTAMTKEEALAVIFTENSPKDRTTARKYLKKYDLIPYRCECDNRGEWRGKPLSLQIDHINGVSDDHRLTNLRWICPNCHSQTPTFAGKALKNPNSANSMRAERVKDPSYNRFKVAGLKNRKYVRPSKEELEKLAWEMPLHKVAEKIGVPTHQTVQKWCKAYSIKLPGKSYWKRRSAGHSHEVSLSLLPVKPKRAPYTTPEQDELIVRLYADNFSVRAIAKHFNLYKDAVTLRLKKRGITIRRDWKGAKREVPSDYR